MSSTHCWFGSIRGIYGFYTRTNYTCTNQQFLIMGSFGNTASNADATGADKENSFKKLLRQRWMGSEDCFEKHRVLGRYYVAAMLFSAVAIYIWSYLNIICNTSYHNYYEVSTPFHPALKNSTATGFAIIYGLIGLEICVQIPGALLIYTISSHKFLTLAVAISSIIHMLTPLALDSSSLVVAIFTQKLLVAPLRIAVLSMWKDWAPPNARKFVILSLSLWILIIPSAPLFSSFISAFMTEASFYASGACGLAWSLLWFFTVSDTPANDSQVLQNKEICLHNNTFPILKGKPKLSELPWKNILTSMPVFSLCLLYFQTGSSFLLLGSLDIGFFPPRQEIQYKLLVLLLCTAILFISALITDFLSRKYPGKIKMRKGIISGALIIHAILLFGILFDSKTVVVVFICLSNIALCTSLTGIFTNALDLSSQYVSIIGGFIETSYLLGMFVSFKFITNYFPSFSDVESEYAGYIYFFCEIGFTIIVAAVFYVWGSLEEQPWSLNSSPGQENANPQSHSVKEEHELRDVQQNT